MTQQEFQELIVCKEDGRMLHRENAKLEFKANFNINSMNEYAKTFAAFSNNVGGIMVFGIQDAPREPKGMTNAHFEDADPQKISRFLNDYLAPEVEWDMFSFTVDDRKFGVFSINESKSKPVMCVKSSNKHIFEGEIYYRYRGRNDKIKYAELKKMLDTQRELEQKKWMEHIQNIAKIGPQNIALVDILRGNIGNGSGKEIIIDKKLLKEIKFIQEGKFVEKDGAPALKLLGSVSGVETYTPDLNLDKDYYTTKELAEELGLLTAKQSAMYMSAIIWKYDIQSKSEYYQHKNHQKLYSKLCLEYLSEQEISFEDAKKIYKEYLGRKK